MAVCYLGLGSNLGNRRKFIRLALQRVGALEKTKVIKVSRFFETEPQGFIAASPGFINAAAKIRTPLSALKLLKELKDIESKLGRKKLKGPRSRPIDLDILFYGNKRINLPYLKVPHPRVTERDFVLRPLKDIAGPLIKSLSAKMKVISKISSMREFVRAQKAKGRTIGFVPTMGALHQGHLSLIRQAKRDNDRCVASIFVNPIQFGPKEDYKKYPRDLERDSILARRAGCDCVFFPDAREMYPEDYLTYVFVEKITDCLCGMLRPGHFKGVTTVVSKLFNIIGPDIAYFGQKDYQQALVIKKMVEDLNMPLKIKVMPTVRESDGLAMSSRNAYLSAQERLDAAVLYQSLKKAEAMISQGERNSQKIIREMRKMILKKKTAKIDYALVADAQTLVPVNVIQGKTLIALAARIGKTRLIDNTVAC
jgi:pantoate--beta-alanine ligase